jgi:ABC-type glycerol-3-phosphate transport system permease component
VKLDNQKCGNTTKLRAKATSQPECTASGRLRPRFPRLNPRASRVVTAIPREALLLAVAVIYLLPLWWVAASSLRPAGSLYQYAIPISWQTFFPGELTVANFANIFTRLDFGQAMSNTFLVSAVTVALGLVVNSMAGFALARFDFPCKRLVFVIILITFIAPFDAIVIPLHQVVSDLGLINTRAALILPAVGNGLAIFLFKQSFEGIPSELLEAARTDGASWWRIFWQIVMPMSLPALSTAAVMMFLFQWNSLFWPLIAAFSSKYRMVQVAVATQIAADQTHWANLFASAVMGSLPPIILFLLLQKRYLKGIAGMQRE